MMLMALRFLAQVLVYCSIGLLLVSSFGGDQIGPELGATLIDRDSVTDYFC
jgi:hypothetical protein